MLVELEGAQAGVDTHGHRARLEEGHVSVGIDAGLGTFQFYQHGRSAVALGEGGLVEVLCREGVPLWEPYSATGLSLCLLHSEPTLKPLGRHVGLKCPRRDVRV